MTFGSRGHSAPGLALSDDDILVALERREDLDSLLTKLRLELQEVAARVAARYSIDDAQLAEKIEGTLVVCSLNGRTTIGRRVTPHNKPSVLLDLLEMFGSAPHPAAAILAYFRLVFESKAQRLSQQYRRLQRESLRAKRQQGLTTRAQSEVNDRLEGLLGKLSALDLQILRLCFLEDVTQEVAAEVLGTTRDRVQARVSYIRQLLRSLE